MGRPLSRGCKCIEKVDKALKEQNTRLVVAIFLDGSPERAIIEVEKIDSKNRTRPKRMIASFCPFCGKKYLDRAVDKTKPCLVG